MVSEQPVIIDAKAAGRSGAAARRSEPGADGKQQRRVGAAARRAAREGIVRAGGIAVVVGIWWSIALVSNPVRVPSPGRVFSTLISDLQTIPALEYVAYQSGGILSALEYTTINVVVGVALGTLAGVVLGSILGRVRVARDLLSVPLLLLGTIPILVLLPFLVIWFGTARLVQSGLVIVFALVTVTAVTQQATEDVSRRYAPYASCLGASQRTILRRVVVPGIVPRLVGAIRVAAATGWSFATVAELLGGQQGTGKLIQAMEGLSDTTTILAVVVAVGIAAVLLDFIIGLVGAWVIRWQE